MKIEFRTKQESKRTQEKAFLALSPAERMQCFFRMLEQVSMFPTEARPEENNNLVIVIKSKRKENRIKHPMSHVLCPAS